jgi:hypothetical protein
MPARGRAAQPGWWTPRHQPPGCAPGPEHDSDPHNANQQHRKDQVDETSTAPRQAPHRDHGTGLRRPGSQCGRHPRGPCRDPPGSCHGRSSPAGFAVPAAGPMLTMPLTPGRPAQNRHIPPRRRAGGHVRSGPTRGGGPLAASIAIASGRYPHGPASRPARQIEQPYCTASRPSAVAGPQQDITHKKTQRRTVMYGSNFTNG